jgi:hypothetical protein
MAKQTATTEPRQKSRKRGKQTQPSAPKRPPFELAVFRLLASTIAMRPRSETKLTENNTDLDLHFTWHGNDKTGRFWVNATAVLYAVHEIFPEEFASISATYRISFDITEMSLFPKDHETGTKIAMALAVPIAWPFWRQYFFDTLTKMGYPPFMLPLVHLPAPVSYQPIPPTDHVEPPTGLEPRS